MAIKGVAYITGLQIAGESHDQMKIEFEVISADGTNLNDNVVTGELASNALSATINNAVSAAAKDKLEYLGVEFGLGDTVRVLNGLL